MTITVNLWDGETGEVTGDIGLIGWDWRGPFIAIEDRGKFYISCLCDNNAHPHLMTIQGWHNLNITKTAWQEVEAAMERFSAHIASAAKLFPASWVRIPAARQRELFGGVPFGRREVLHQFELRGFEVKRKVAFGQDTDYQYWTYQQIASLVATDDNVVGKKD